MNYLEKRAAKRILIAKLAGRTAATIAGPLIGPLSGLFAEKGRGWETAGGAVLGGIAGTSLAAPLLQIPKAGIPLGIAAALGGPALGAYLAHGPDRKKKKKKKKG